MTTPLLTIARNALWNSINNWSELKNSPTDANATKFNRVYRCDQIIPQIEEINPTLPEMPALAIVPVNTVPVWWTNEMQQWPTLYDIVLWTPNWSFTQPEQFIEWIANALYRSVHPNGGYSYIKAPQTASPPGTGYYPQRLGPITFTRTNVSGPSIVTKFSIALRLQRDPFAP